MSRVAIPVLCLEFDEGGNTLWVQGKDGTILRVKVRGSFRTTTCGMSPVSHLDLLAQDEDPVFCLGTDAGDSCKIGGDRS